MSRGRAPRFAWRRRARLLLSVLAGAVLALGCGIHAPVYRPGSGAGAPEVIVHPFGTSQASGGYAGPTDFGRLFAEYLAGALQVQACAPWSPARTSRSRRASAM